MIAQEDPIGKVQLRAETTAGEQQEYEPAFKAPGAAALIVDDNELNISVAAKLLSATDIQIDTAGSGREALAHTQEKHYDVILMDHLMPDMDGIETLHAIRAQRGGMCRETPVIALTANAGSDNEAMYRRNGFDGYLLKPITGSELENAVMARLPRSLVKSSQIVRMDAGEAQVMDAFHRKANMIITTDSLCDLPIPLLMQNRIEMIPLRIITDEGRFADRTEVTTGETLRYMQKFSDRRIVAEPPSVSEYEAFFAGCLLRADHVFHITTSAWGEKTYQNAIEAARSFGNVTIFDSGQISAGVGAYVLRAASIIEASNVPPQALFGILSGMRGSIRSALIVDNTAMLLRSGRITARQNTIFQNFLLRPIFVPTRKGVRIRGFAGGPRKQYTERFFRKMISRPEADHGRLLVISPSMLPEEAQYMEGIIKKHIPFREIRFLQAGPSTTLTWGPDSLAIVYETRSK
jgi:DegV family protein with EDD domain